MISDKLGKVFFRADGNSQIGLGHIYRCCALAQMLISDYTCHLVVKNIHENLKTEMLRYFNYCYEFGDNEIYQEQIWWKEMLTGNEIVILDGYKFDTEYQTKLKKICSRLICIDDICAYHFCADAVINHAGGLSSSMYSKEPFTKLFLGPSYAMVRSVFWNRPSISSRSGNDIFVCLGGADPENSLMYVLKNALSENYFLNYHIVTGIAYQYERELKEFLSDRPAVRHYRSLDADSIKTLMQKSAIAICSPSTVSYEYLSIGGELYLYPIADNQVNIYRYLTQASLAFPFDDFKIKEKKQVSEVLENQIRVFDGKSHMRIKEAIING